MQRLHHPTGKFLVLQNCNNYTVMDQSESSSLEGAMRGLIDLWQHEEAFRKGPPLTRYPPYRVLALHSRQKVMLLKCERCPSLCKVSSMHKWVSSRTLSASSPSGKSATTLIGFPGRSLLLHHPHTPYARLKMKGEKWRKRDRKAFSKHFLTSPLS